ncbi:hypothetical protein D3C72_1720700 [compost metagenome]
MAIPTDDFLNQAIDEVVAVLEASPDFMSDEASSPPADASGVIKCVEDYFPSWEDIPANQLPHCSVGYLGDEPNLIDSAASGEDYTINLGIRLYHRGTDRRQIWRDLLKAGAAVAKILSYEMSPEGANFNGFVTNAQYLGGEPIDTHEPSAFGGCLTVRVALQISRPD